MAVGVHALLIGMTSSPTSGLSQRARHIPDYVHVNPNGSAIALGHPRRTSGASGFRLLITALYQLQLTQSRYALRTLCIGVGQDIPLIFERV
jgi:acetyl-CoA acetyltransferase